MLSGQHIRVASLAWSIAMLGYLAACSDVSSPAHTRALGPSARAAAVDSTPGLVAAYGFDEASGSSVGDASVFANNGTFGSGVWRTTGRFGGALGFNGSGRVTIPSTASLCLTNAMTLEAWINPSVVDASWRDVIYKGNDNYYLMATSSQGGVPAGGASFGNISATTEAYAPSALATGVWTHIAVTYDGSIIRLYVNGAQVATRSKTGTYTTSSNPLQIGGNTFYWQYFKGKIDEVRVYNRALGAAEIQQDMNTAVTAAPPADTAAPAVSTPPKATQLAVTTQPSPSAQSGVAFARQPVVQLRDANGAAVAQSGVAVIALIASGGGTLGGTSTATTDANGVATFSNLSLGGTVGARVLIFTSGLLTPAISNGVAITAGPVAKFVVSTIGQQTASAPFNVTVTLADAYGNTAPNGGASGVITLSRRSGTGSLGGTTSAAMAVGASAVTISGVTYSKAETGVSFTATGSGSGSGVAGQSGASNSFTVVAPGDTTGVHTYTTNFPGIESPISEGGRWINGGTNGSDWSDVWSTGGNGIGRQTGADYSDATALLTGTWSASQQVTATVFTSSTVSDACYPEVELRLRSAISAHVNRGYEISFKVSQSGSAYLIIVRWNGPFGDFTYLLKTNGAQYGVKDGDVISAKMVGNVITAYKNGVVMGSASDNTYADGAPGMGFNLANAPAGCPGSNDKYGYTQFSATDGVP